MNRIEIRLPGNGEAQSLASFYADQHPNSNHCDKLCHPIRQRALGSATDELWLAAGPVTTRQQGRFQVTQARDYQFLTIEVPDAVHSMRTSTEAAYRELLALINGSDYPQLLRFWNYIPEINQGSGDAEVYRQFCWGRAEALEVEDRALPAATGIGSADGVLRISALTASAAVTVRHLENPRQLSAYRYPRQYGPRSPSFARATEVSLNDMAILLLSGTSSIVHHQTRHPHNLCAQTAETRRNIAELVATAAHADRLKPKHMRYYLRKPEELCSAQNAYQSAFPDYPSASFVQGDICRVELMMEIDGVFATDC
ncbi:MAG: hypothetical protein ACR2PZ_14455 [Pseudomonadales bacterium]